MTKAPERIWAGEVDGYGQWWRSRDIVGNTEYTRTDLSNALIGAAYEAAAADIQDRGGKLFDLWHSFFARSGYDAFANRVKALTDGLPDTIAERIRALTPADARAALERVAQPRWYRMDDAENPPPEPEVYHMRGIWWCGKFLYDIGRIHKDTGYFVDRFDDLSPFNDEKYTHWTPLLAPPEDEG